MSTLLKSWVVAAIISSCAGLVQAQINVDYDAPPDSEAGLFDRSTAIVRGRVEGRRLADHSVDQGPAMTAYSVRVVEVFKSDGRFKVGEVVEVHRFGGMGGNPLTADANFPEFQVNDELVLFLERTPRGIYMPIFGPEGAFQLKEGRAHAFGRAGAVSKQHNGKTTDAFLSEMRKHRK